MNDLLKIYLLNPQTSFTSQMHWESRADVLPLCQTGLIGTYRTVKATELLTNELHSAWLQARQFTAALFLLRLFRGRSPNAHCSSRCAHFWSGSFKMGAAIVLQMRMLMRVQKPFKLGSGLAAKDVKGSGNSSHAGFFICFQMKLLHGKRCRCLWFHS